MACKVTLSITEKTLFSSLMTSVCRSGYNNRSRCLMFSIPVLVLTFKWLCGIMAFRRVKNSSPRSITSRISTEHGAGKLIPYLKAFSMNETNINGIISVGRPSGVGSSSHVSTARIWILSCRSRRIRCRSIVSSRNRISLAMGVWSRFVSSTVCGIAPDSCSMPAAVRSVSPERAVP